MLLIFIIWRNILLSFREFWLQMEVVEHQMFERFDAFDQHENRKRREYHFLFIIKRKT